VAFGKAAKAVSEYKKADALVLYCHSWLRFTSPSSEIGEEKP
jgi:hypothetical protein